MEHKARKKSKAPRDELERMEAFCAARARLWKRTKHTKNTEERGAGVPAEGVSPKEAYEAFRPHLAEADNDLLKRIAADIPERVSPTDAYEAFRLHLKKADDALLKLIEDDIADARAGRALKPLDSSHDDEDDDDLERVALEIRLNVDSENVRFVLSSKKTDIYVLVDGQGKTKRSKKLPSVYASVLAPLMHKGLATLEFKSIGCPGYIHVEVVGTKLQPILPPSVQELESAWED